MVDREAIGDQASNNSCAMLGSPATTSTHIGTDEDFATGTSFQHPTGTNVRTVTLDQELSVVSVEECNQYIDGLDFVENVPTIEEVAQDWVVARIPIDGMRLRPGGYIPGPVMMTAVDLVAWFLVFTRNGFTPMALTWELKINFLRPAHGADLIVKARQTKFGKLCHASIDLHMDGDPDRLVAHATTTYVLPADS